jgi:glycosyltransferase involved in cell wall biosynthesis
VVLKASANGIPVLASRVGVVPEAMGKSGVLLAAGDEPEQWTQAIEEALGDRSGRKRSGSTCATWRELVAGL